MFGNLGAPEIILILLIVLIFFGAKKIPELAQGLGKGMREFKKATRDVQEDIEKETKPESEHKDKKEVKG
jgi:sec-independent protein translocase protein TatA